MPPARDHAPDPPNTAPPEDQLSFVLVVAPAAQRDVLHRRQSTEGIRHDVVELQERALGASLSVLAHVAASAAVPSPCGALNVIRDFTRGREGRRLIRPGADRSSALRPRRGRELRLLDLLEEQRDGAIEDGARISVRDFAAKQRLKAPQLVVRVLADRELDAIALR